MGNFFHPVYLSALLDEDVSNVRNNRSTKKNHHQSTTTVYEPSMNFEWWWCNPLCWIMSIWKTSPVKEIRKKYTNHFQQQPKKKNRLTFFLILIFLKWQINNQVIICMGFSFIWSVGELLQVVHRFIGPTSALIQLIFNESNYFKTIHYLGNKVLHCKSVHIINDGTSLSSAWAGINCPDMRPRTIPLILAILPTIPL